MSKNRTCMEKWLEETRQEVNQFLRDVPFHSSHKFQLVPVSFRIEIFKEIH